MKTEKIGWRLFPDITPAKNPYAMKPNTLSQKKRRQRARWPK
jgi:hypothetical protein